jgi:hypothetical protein
MFLLILRPFEGRLTGTLAVNRHTGRRIAYIPVTQAESALNLVTVRPNACSPCCADSVATVVKGKLHSHRKEEVAH